MTLSLSILLIPYYLGLLVFFVFSFFNLYHLIRFGVSNSVTLTMIFIYLGVSLLILLSSWYFVSQIGWTTPIDFWAPYYQF